ncbi:hypothetical protein Acr_01g0010550 [Actinidia rufa]|uniref:Uncharacterized protein n=1 Tax=Actinidia rufa TaxID=165716 RepID=A0A7J0E4Y3_9ERIC|nr:hypothetical protein Acr_01g0010550 [Actinidia rufa]
MRWHNWHPMSPLRTHLGDRILYDSTMQNSTRVEAIMSRKDWKWPNRASHHLMNIREAIPRNLLPDESKEDVFIWCGNGNNRFSINSAFYIWRNRRPVVNWHREFGFQFSVALGFIPYIWFYHEDEIFALSYLSYRFWLFGDPRRPGWIQLLVPSLFFSFSSLALRDVLFSKPQVFLVCEVVSSLETTLLWEVKTFSEVAPNGWRCASSGGGGEAISPSLKWGKHGGGGNCDIVQWDSPCLVRRLGDQPKEILQQQMCHIGLTKNGMSRRVKPQKTVGPFTFPNSPRDRERGIEGLVVAKELPPHLWDEANYEGEASGWWWMQRWLCGATFNGQGCGLGSLALIDWIGCAMGCLVPWKMTDLGKQWRKTCCWSMGSNSLEIVSEVDCAAFGPYNVVGPSNRMPGGIGSGIYRTPSTFLDAKKRDEMDLPDPIPKRCGVSRGHNTAWVSFLPRRLKWKVGQRDVAQEYNAWGGIDVRSEGVGASHGGMSFLQSAVIPSHSCEGWGLSDELDKQLSTSPLTTVEAKSMGRYPYGQRGFQGLNVKTKWLGLKSILRDWKLDGEDCGDGGEEVASLQCPICLAAEKIFKWLFGGRYIHMIQWPFLSRIDWFPQSGRSSSNPVTEGGAHDPPGHMLPPPLQEMVFHDEVPLLGRVKEEFSRIAKNGGDRLEEESQSFVDKGDRDTWFFQIVEFTLMEDRDHLKRPFTEEKVVDVYEGLNGIKLLVGAEGIRDFRPISLIGSAMSAWICEADVSNTQNAFADFGVIRRMSLGIKWRRWMRFFITAVWLPVLGNCSPTGFFQFSMGMDHKADLSSLTIVVHCGDGGVSRLFKRIPCGSVLLSWLWIMGWGRMVWRRGVSLNFPCHISPNCGQRGIDGNYAPDPGHGERVVLGHWTREASSGLGWCSLCCMYKELLVRGDDNMMRVCVQGWRQLKTRCGT